MEKCPGNAYSLTDGLRACKTQNDACNFFAYETEITLPDRNSARDKLCLARCPLYRLESGECVQRCSGFVESDGLCVSACRSRAFLVDAQDTSLRRCLSAGCPAPLLKVAYISGQTECAGVCPSAVPFEYADTCVSACPEAAPFVRGGACVPECPKYVQASTVAGVAVLKCVAQCGASITWKNGTALCSGCGDGESGVYDFAMGRFVRCVGACSPASPEVVSGVCAAQSCEGVVSACRAAPKHCPDKFADANMRYL